MIDFANAQSITIPEGEVASIARNGEILWRKKYKKELAYLKSTGTQYIDTDVNADSNLGFEITYKIDSLTNTENRWGAIRQNGSSYIRHHSSMDSAQGMLRYYFNIGDKGYLPTDLNKHTVSLDTDECTLTVDGVANSFEQEVFDCRLNYWLFGRNGNTASLTNYSKMTIYKCRLSKNGVLVRDLIPVLDWNDRPCMYDKVTDERFYNKGTGEFLYA